ncbi:venom carboxylesterase-6-like [Galleria mellonella]|uniref:Carboxylic ester hydrolase n=1 Tax=Galleria mellonella TaxID=7137 RepID=A0ABM3MP66_GALME|nr:venom carboxylesterase-6-like [Galleria mellonella]
MIHKTVVLLFILIGSASTYLSPIVNLTDGAIHGVWKTSVKGRTFASFYGIPYAEPPINKNRFKDAEPPQTWTGVRDASKPLAHCLQYEPSVKRVTGSENCLYVNVHTANLNPEKLLPVVVFIHGGAFMYGSGYHYGPFLLMDRDLVVVTLHYRLGPLGFLSTGDDVLPGNLGLKDQAFALHWIKKNIRAFGGNPDSITLTGHSAGGSSVHYHLLSPMSRGTFARAIAYSGSAFAPWAFAEKPVEKAKALATLVGCPTNSSQDMIDCLTDKPGEDIVGAQVHFTGWKDQMFTEFIPTIEPQGSKNPFLTQHPYEATRSGDITKVPLIASVTSEEGLYPAAAYVKPNVLPELEDQWEDLAATIFQYNDTLSEDQHKNVASKIKKYYFDGKPINQETYPQLVQALSDRLFVVDVNRLAQTYAESSRQPVYVYRYSFRGEKSFTTFLTHDYNNYGVSHADDLFHIFYVDTMVGTTSADHQMSDIMIDVLYSFASTGVPNLTDEGKWLPVDVGSTELNYLEISSPQDIETKNSSDFGHKSFWDSLGFVENEQYNK